MKNNSKNEIINEEYEEVKVFMNTINNVTIFPTDTKIIIFELNGRSKNDGQFTRLLKNQLKIKPRLNNPKIFIEDFSNKINMKNYYKLDAHLNATGHEKIAAALYESLLKYSN